eukprot:7451258-Pyramimonas_sp.AAC.1
MYTRAAPKLLKPSHVEVESNPVVYGCLFLLYTIVLIFVGFLAGQYSFDPVEQSRREMHNWRSQSQSWRDKVNALKRKYNKAHHIPYTNDTCSVCDECSPPTFCWHKPGVVCPAYWCEELKMEPYKDRASLLSELSDAALHTKMLKRAADTFTGVVDTYTELAAELNRNPQEECPSCESQCKTDLELLKAERNRQDCDTYGILQKLDRAESRYRETGNLVAPVRNKVAHKARVDRLAFEDWQQCLALTMPPLYAAYMEILLARSIRRPPPPAPYPPRLLKKYTHLHHLKIKTQPPPPPS